MPRIERAILAGYPHHVTQRGNSRQPVFEDDADLLRRLKQNTHTGRPCGGATFIKKIESLLNRPLQPKKHGRPKKQNQ
jgi:hypothetical protein